jgi:hypothetical protein
MKNARIVPMTRATIIDQNCLLINIGLTLLFDLIAQSGFQRTTVKNVFTEQDERIVTFDNEYTLDSTPNNRCILDMLTSDESDLMRKCRTNLPS